MPTSVIAFLLVACMQLVRVFTMGGSAADLTWGRDPLLQFLDVLGLFRSREPPEDGLAGEPGGAVFRGRTPKSELRFHCSLGRLNAGLS